MFAPLYKEITCKTKVKAVTVDGETTYIPDLPISTPGLVLVYCEGRNYYAYPLPASTNGKDCICHVVYSVEDDAKMKSFLGSLGSGAAVCALTDYKKVVTVTVADVKIAEEKAKIIDKAISEGKVPSQVELDAVKYTEADKDEGYPQWVFLTKGYVDK